MAVDAPATVLYSVMTLIRFYRATLNAVIYESVLDVSLGDLLELSEKSFVSRLQRETRVALGEKAEPPGTDLVPAPSVSRLLSLLNEVLSVASIAEDREKDMLQVLLSLYYIIELRGIYLFLLIINNIVLICADCFVYHRSSLARSK